MEKKQEVDGVTEAFSPDILYEDRQLVVCVKPVGWLSEPGGKSLPDALSAYYAARGESKDIFTVHRLDRVVGGVMVFARTKEAASHLARAVAAREVDKEYLAILRGVPEQPADTLTDLLFRDASQGKTFVVKRPRRGVREAKLAYRLLETVTRGDGQPLSLVEVRLYTGRTHQIRVQFSSRGLPLLGDIRYGSKDPDCTAALWSHRLSFRHPKTGKPMSFEKQPPSAYPWSLFPTAHP